LHDLTSNTTWIWAFLTAYLPFAPLANSLSG